MSRLIRPAAARDVESVVDLWQRSHGGDRAEQLERAARWFLPGREDLQLVCELDGTVVAWARAAHMDCTAEGPENCVPAAWYLLGLNVHRDVRRRGIARELTARRLDWMRLCTDISWYFTRRDNLPSLALHRAFGFERVVEDVWFPGLDPGGEPSVLCRAILGGRAPVAG